MRIWTVHPLDLWERLEAEGTLTVDPTYYTFDDEGYIPWQYQWMAARLKERIPGHHGGLPWYAYCEKPDLRWVRHGRQPGQPHVRIELDVADALAFPDWGWNVVFLGRFLAFTEIEQEAWETPVWLALQNGASWPLPEPWRSELEASWLRLFSPDLPIRGWGQFTSRLIMQAVFETMRLEDVRAVTHFVGSNHRLIKLLARD